MPLWLQTDTELNSFTEKETKQTTKDQDESDVELVLLSNFY